jgi:hypothetical protein
MSNINARREIQVVRNKGIRQIEAKIDLGAFTVALGSDVIRHIDVYVPSARLSMGGEAYFEATVGDFQIGNGTFSSRWVVRARAKGNRLISNPLHRVDPSPDSVLTSQLLPRSYETDSAVKILRFEMDLNCPLNAIAVPFPGSWFFRAYWEPNDTSITDEELTVMFSLCHAELVVAIG